AKLLIVVGRAEKLAAQLMRQPWMLRRLFLGGCLAPEARDGGRIVHPVIWLGRNERRMRPQKREMRDEGSLRRAKVIDHVVDQKGGIVELRRIQERFRMR